MSTLPEVAGESEGLAAKLACLLQAASQQIRFAEMGDPERIVRHLFHGRTLRRGLLQQRQGLCKAAGQSVSISQSRGSPGKHELDVTCPADVKSPFERDEGLGKVPFTKGKNAGAPTRVAQGEGLSNRLGDLHCFLAACPSLGECAQLG